MNKIIIVLTSLYLLSACCSIDYPQYNDEIKKKQMQIITKILNDNKFIETITLDTSLSTEYFYHSVNDTGLSNYISRMKNFDCKTKFLSFETKAVKTHDSTFKIGNLYYFNNQNIDKNGETINRDLIFIFLNLNKKWYLDDILVNESKLNKIDDN